MDASSEIEHRKAAREPQVTDMQAMGPEAPEFDLHSLLGTLSRQLKTIALTMAIVLLAALALILLYDEKYAATSLLEVDDQNERLIRINEQVFEGGSFNGRVDTEAQIIGSSGVALKAIERLKLWQTEEFGLRPSLIDRLAAWAGLDAAGGTGNAVPADFGAIPEDIRDELATKLGNKLDVSRRGLTGIIEVEAKSKSPELAAKIANAVVDAYLNLQIERQVSSAKRAAGFLEERVVELGRTIQDIEDKIGRLTSDNPDFQSRFQQLRREIADVGERRRQGSEILKQLERFEVSSTPSDLAGIDLGNEIAGLLGEHQRLSSTAGADGLQIADLEKRLQTAASDRIAMLRKELGELGDREAPLHDALQKILAQPSTMTEAGVSLFRLQRESDTNRKLYDSYVARLGEVQQRIALTLPNSRVVASAMVPHRPGFPQRTALGALALLVAAGLGFAAAFVREHLIGGFTSREQLESVTQANVLAAVPAHPDMPHDAPVASPLSAYSESIRRMRVGIENEARAGKPVVVLLTSTLAGEGKSTMAISIARTFAVAGKRTLLIDADLRNPSINRLLGCETGSGIVEIIGSAEVQKAFAASVARDPLSGLDAILGSASGLAGSDLLLGSPSFAKLLQHATRKYQAIVIDSPPVGVVVDPLVILPLVDLVVYVVRYASTGQRHVVAGIRELAGSRNARPLVTVLNLSRDVPGGYYHYRYGAGGAQEKFGSQ